MTLSDFAPWMLVVFAAGCSSSSEEPPPANAARPFAGRTVTVAVPAELQLAESWELMLVEWSEQTGAEHRLAEYTAEEELTAGIIEQPASVVIVPTRSIAALAATGRLLPLPDDVQASSGLHWLDVFGGLREAVGSIERRPAVVPLSSPVLVCYYRSDLLRDAGLSPPETWADYQELLDALEKWAPGLTAVEPWGEEFRATMFLSRALATAKHPGNYSLFFDIETGKPLIDSPGFVRALDEARRAIAAMPSEVRDYTPADSRREFLDGRAALAIAFEGVAREPPVPFLPAGKPTATAAEAGEQDFAAGFRPLPGSSEVYNRSNGQWEPPPGGRVNRVTLTGFGGICLAVVGDRASTDSRAAWNLVEQLAVRNASSAFPGGLLTPCRNSQLADAARWTGPGLAAVASPADYVSSVGASLRDQPAVSELPVVGRALFREALTEGLSRGLDETQPSADVLNAVAERWSEIAGEIGEDEVLDSYRRSLGLPQRAGPLP